MRSKSMPMVLVAATAIFLGSVAASGNNGTMPILLVEHEFEWEDPESGGVVLMMESVFRGCPGFNPYDMLWVYTVTNLSYDPIPGITNGFSGFQLLFPQPVPELYNQQSPDVGGPWDQNAYSGQAPPFGAEWDVRLPGMGIMPGEIGQFSFCTSPREDLIDPSAGPGQGPAGWGHTWGLPAPEPIIDADGSASRFDGVPDAVEVFVLALLTSWPTGRYIEGLDLFDNDGDGQWTFGPMGDDLHVEDPQTHPGAIRDGTHDDFLDPLVLDLDDSLNTTPGNEPVSCDMETGTFCPPTLPGNIRFYDTNMNGFWDDGEDIVFDANGDEIFGEVINTQNFIFHGPQSIPGRIRLDLDIKPGSCPNSYNRIGNGVLPVAIVGTPSFDVTQIDITTLQLSRADGVGGFVQPHEGPPGPHSTLEDAATPFLGPSGAPECGCHELEGDGILDLSLKFKTAELVEVLELTDLDVGELPGLQVTGMLLDGTPFVAEDCVRIVGPPGPPGQVNMSTTLAGAWIGASPLDEALDGGGFGPFERTYPHASVVKFTAERVHNGRAFRGWKVDGGPLQEVTPTGGLDLTMVVENEVHSVEAVYASGGARRCGLGSELILLVPPLLWLQRRRRRA